MKKFDFVIGNPPYDQFNENNGRKEPLYHNFMDEAFKVSRCAVLIHPARFLFDAGQTPKKWNEKMLNDTHFKVLLYKSDSNEVFPTLKTPIKGGVAVTIRDESKKYGAMKSFVTNDILRNIFQKVMQNEKIFLSGIISPRGLYRVTDDFFKDYPDAKLKLGSGTGNMIASNFFEKLPEVYLDEIDDNIRCDFLKFLCRIDNKRKLVFINKKHIKDNDFISKFKIAIPKSNGTGVFGEQLSSPEILEPFEGSTDTFINIGKLKSMDEAINLVKYVKTKFLRTMLGIKKVTQDNSRRAWDFVPIQDFTENSDIDWSQSIPEIDQQLYKKYNLSKDEIDFIKEKVQEMK